MNPNLFWCITGIIGGAIVTLIFYLIDNKKCILKYNIITTPLMYNTVSQIENLTITYDEYPINRLYCSKINIKNNSKYIIEQSSFSSKEPLTISTNGILLLNKQVSNTQKVFLKASNTESENIPKNALICYEYFPIKETLSLIVYHTDDIFISGKLKNGKIVKNRKLKTKKFYILFVIILISFILNFLIVRFIEHKNLDIAMQNKEASLQLM